MTNECAIAQFTHEYRFLSNFYPSPLTPPTLEHQYQAMKTFDQVERLRIMDAKTPAGAKALGKLVKFRKDWEYIKVRVMMDLLTIKFSDPTLRAKLLETGNRELIEGNWWHDNFWGACTCLRCHDKPKQNLLGKLLMKVREELSIEALQG